MAMRGDPVASRTVEEYPLEQRGGEFEARLAVGEDVDVGVHQGAHPFGNAVGDTGDDHAAIAVSHQDDVVESLEFHDRHDIVDMGVQIRCGRE
ncbi:hypothetical protein ABIA39_004091 [Nocardia sp. GAS34]